MTMPFASVQSRIASAVTRHLADATADFGGGILVDGLFREPCGEAFGGFVTGSSPTFEAESGALSGVARGAAVTVKGVVYRIKSLKPDGQGMTMLELEAQ